MAVVDIRFNDWSELIEYCKKDLPAASREWCSSNVHRDMPADSFYGPKLDKCLELLRDGWTDKLSAAQTVSATLVNKVTAKMERHDIIYDVEGAQIDIGRYVDGEPECWQQFVPTIVDGTGNRILRFCFDICVSASVKPASIERLGVCLSALVECLELAGYRVEITVMARFGSRTETGKVWLDFRTILKEADQPLDLGRLLFAFAHPAMLRRVVFDVADHQPVSALQHRSYASMMGIPQTDIVEGYDIFLAGRVASSGMTEDESVAWVMEQLRKNGVELND